MADKTVGRQVANLLDNHGFSCLMEFGYDAAKGEYVDMQKAGILDTLKVTRTVLVDASRRNMHSSLLTTTEAVSELPKDGSESAGDMGAMDFDH